MMFKFKHFISILGLITFCNTNGGTYITENVRKIENITGYQFRDRELLRDVFQHHSLYGDSNFQKLEFLGDGVIAAIVRLNTFNPNKPVGTLHEDVKKKTTNRYLAKISRELGLYSLAHHNPENSSESIAADAFEALVGAMQLDFEQHPHQLSPAAINFVLKAFNMPISPQIPLANSNALSLRDHRHFVEGKPSTYYENADSNRAITLAAGLSIVGVMGAGVDALWNWWSSSPDYKKMYEECKLQKNIYKSLCFVLGCVLCWPYISSYFGFTNTAPQT